MAFRWDPREENYRVNAFSWRAMPRRLSILLPVRESETPSAAEGLQRSTLQNASGFRISPRHSMLRMTRKYTAEWVKSCEWGMPFSNYASFPCCLTWWYERQVEASTGCNSFLMPSQTST